MLCLSLETITDFRRSISISSTFFFQFRQRHCQSRRNLRSSFSHNAAAGDHWSPACHCHRTEYWSEVSFTASNPITKRLQVYRCLFIMFLPVSYLTSDNSGRILPSNIRRALSLPHFRSTYFAHCPSLDGRSFILWASDAIN